MKLKFMTPRQAKKDQYTWKEKIEKERIEKEEIYTAEGREIEEKDDGKASRKARCLIEGHSCLVAFVYESDNNVISTRLVEKVQLATSFHLNQARIKLSIGQCVKEVLYDIAPTNSCHLLLRWASLHFKMLNLDERSHYLRNEGHEMKLKSMTPRQASKDQQRLKEKIEKERNINCRRKGN